MGELRADEPRIDDKARPDLFLAEIEARAQLPGYVSSTTAAIAAMCTLADRLTTGQAHDLLEALPEPIQLLFVPCFARRSGPVARLDDAGFLQRISDCLDVTPAHAELICDRVFSAARARLPAEVIAHVAAQLPGGLRDLWRGTRAPIAETAVITEAGARHRLLAEIAQRAPLPPEISAPDALSAVMCIFAHRLSGGEAHDVLLGLPDAVRSLVEHCLRRRDEDAEVFDRGQLVGRVAGELGTDPARAEQIVRAVLAAVKRLLPIKEVHDVTSQLPPDLRETWATA